MEAEDAVAVLLLDLDEKPLDERERFAQRVVELDEALLKRLGRVVVDREAGGRGRNRLGRALQPLNLDAHECRAREQLLYFSGAP